MLNPPPDANKCAERLILLLVYIRLRMIKYYFIVRRNTATGGLQLPTHRKTLRTEKNTAEKLLENRIRKETKTARLRWGDLSALAVDNLKNLIVRYRLS